MDAAAHVFAQFGNQPGFAGVFAGFGFRAGFLDAGLLHPAQRLQHLGGIFARVKALFGQHHQMRFVEAVIELVFAHLLFGIAQLRAFLDVLGILRQAGAGLAVRFAFGNLAIDAVLVHCYRSP